jgi:trehalose 6-phosphate phosphatase
VTTEQLRPFVTAPERAGIFLDFDGTLSEIVQIPSDARPIAGARDVLDRLAAFYRLVVIVSGRSAEQLVEWLGPEVEIWGVHGAERATNGRVELSERAGPYANLMRRVHADASNRLAQLNIPGIVLEDKGVMLGLHFRAAPDVEQARRALDAVAADLAGEYGLTRAGCRLAFELRPPVEFSKAQVVLDRAREARLGAAAFVGDDRVDLPGFDALDMLEGEGVSALRVAVRSDEVPQELIERADLVVDGPVGALGFLTSLLEV